MASFLLPSSSASSNEWKRIMIYLKCPLTILTWVIFYLSPSWQPIVCCCCCCALYSNTRKTRSSYHPLGFTTTMAVNVHFEVCIQDSILISEKSCQSSLLCSSPSSHSCQFVFILPREIRRTFLGCQHSGKLIMRPAIVHKRHILVARMHGIREPQYQNEFGTCHEDLSCHCEGP